MSQSITPALMKTLRKEITEGRVPANEYMAALLLGAFSLIDVLRKQNGNLHPMEHSEECLEPWKCKAGCCTFYYDELVKALKDNNIPIPGHDEEVD